MGDIDNNEVETFETIDNDAYLLKCKCPVCQTLIARDYDEKTFFCNNCGTKLHHNAFSKDEINEALLQNQIDDYEK